MGHALPVSEFEPDPISALIFVTGKPRYSGVCASRGQIRDSARMTDFWPVCPISAQSGAGDERIERCAVVRPRDDDLRVHAQRHLRIGMACLRHDVGNISSGGEKE